MFFNIILYIGPARIQMSPMYGSGSSFGAKKLVSKRLRFRFHLPLNWYCSMDPVYIPSAPPRRAKFLVHLRLRWFFSPFIIFSSAMLETPNHQKSVAAEEDDLVVNPWQVSAEGGKIDYDKLIDRFGCQRLDQSLVQRVERLTSLPAHVFLRRGVFFAHR